MTMVTVTDAPGPAALSSSPVAIRPAEANEATALFRLISDNLESGHLLPRPLGEVVLHIPRFLVAVDADGVLGCAELARLSPRVAEIRSLVVRSEARRHGVGARLLQRMMESATEQGFSKVCAFAHDPKPFIRLGFSIVPHPWVPEKISTDCHDCVWFRRCRQYAVVFDIDHVAKKEGPR